MSIGSIYGEAVSAASRRAPEGISIVVVVPETARLITAEEASDIAPTIAGLLFDRRFGSVLHVEPLTERDWEVVVEDLGPTTRVNPLVLRPGEAGY